MLLTFYDKAILIEPYSFFLNKGTYPQLIFLKFNYSCYILVIDRS